MHSREAAASAQHLFLDGDPVVRLENKAVGQVVGKRLMYKELTGRCDGANQGGDSSGTAF